LPENRHTVLFARVFLDWEVALLLIVQFTVTLVLVTRGRGLAVSLFGGATTAMFVILLQWALWSIEGCVSFLQAFYTACPTPQPAFGGGQLMRAGVRGMVVMLAAAGLAVAIGRLRSQRAISGRPERPAGARPGPRRFAAATVAIVAVVSVAVPALRPPTAETAALKEAVATEENAQPPASPEEAHRVWLRSGGATHIEEVADAYDTFRTELEELADTDSTDVSQLVPLLQALADAASRASAFPGPPDHQRSQTWRTELAKVERACRSLIEASTAGTRSFIAALERSAKDLITGVVAVEGFVNT
jgi:hypothetical protein